MERPFDFRSDTVTRPSKQMRAAMAAAIVGDDGFGDDPTIKELEALAAETVGKESALFVPTGTMGNQVALCAHTQPGDEILVEDKGHIAWFEGSGAALNALVQIRTYFLTERCLAPAEAEALLRLPIIDCPTMKLLCVENTLNMHGGVVWPLENLRELLDWAKGHEFAVHLDGARLFNAACAAGVPAADIAACADSVMFCLSKGLGAPIGSIVAGTRDFIDRARRVRKRLGGQMRQVGVLAAAGLIALRENVERLADDHRLARTIAERVADKVPALQPTHAIETNILIYALPSTHDSGEVAAALAAEGVLVCPFPGNAIRIVTHLDVDDRAAERLVVALKKII